MDITFKPKELKPTRNRSNLETIFIDKEFEKRILTHVIANSLQRSIAPCFLAIEGNMGEGKTVQTINTCFKHGIHVYYFSGSQLAGNLERDSVKELEDTYNYLEKNSKEDVYNVIIIDDFHLSVASCAENVSRTVNSQLLTGYLMNLADATKTLSGKKTPIILIANSFEQLYLPLTRDGRMDLFKWEPDENQKKQIIFQMYREVLRDGISPVFENFVTEYIEESIAFFGEVKNDIYIQAIKEYLEEGNFGTLYDVVGRFDRKFQEYDRKFIEVDKIKKYAEIRKSKYRVKKREEQSGDDRCETGCED